MFELMGQKRLDYLTLVAPDGAKVQLEGSEVLVDKTIGTIKQEILEHKLKVPWFSIKLLNGTLELPNDATFWDSDLEVRRHMICFALTEVVGGPGASAVELSESLL